ncbi:antizyme inhibitor isoform X3 [Pontoporia blainvillei]|uniref:Antizyme inhibitor isoform X3 n=1 Tax=Pontoporia blainvillei TaxID=48723 RepID=A0ABX0SEU0_PONBL|nr:antizyme inhibitor isoform X3 [Pontoporia blainvillei]
MKGFIDDANYSVGPLDEGTNLGNVVDNYVYEHTPTGKNAFFVGDLGKIAKKQSVAEHSGPDEAILHESIIYISPCKQASQIKYAAKVGVNIMTCGNEVTLKKLARDHPNAKVLLRIATEDNIGGEEESQVYVHALSDARCAFDMAGEFGFTMNMLDIGFTGTEFRLEEVNHVISPLLDVYFPEGSDTKIVSEPGSYYVSSAFTLAVNIIAKKAVENKFSSGVGKTGSDEPTFMYYMNDGVYGPFASKLSEDLNAIPEVHKKCKEDEPLFTSSLQGPSCDELDQIVENCLLPELNMGDWLIFGNMGA